MRTLAVISLAALLASCGDPPPSPTPAAPAPRVSAPEEPAAPARIVDYAPPLELGEVPDASRGKGECSLRVRLRNADDGTPVAMYARLWRLGVAEDGAFSGGDHIQARVAANSDGATIERLPAGRYRIEVPDQRRGADDPSEFALETGATERVVDVSPRRLHRVRLRVYDESGTLITRANGEIERDDWVSPGPACPPAWASPREEKNAADREAEFRPGKPSACFPNLHRKLPTLDGGADGFDLGEVRDAGRIDAPAVKAEIRMDGRNDVIAFASGAEINAAEVSLVAVSVPHATLIAGVERPDGTPLTADHARVSFAACRPLRCAAEPPADAWRRAVVFVHVEVTDYETLSYEWSADTADEKHVLVERRAR